MRRILLAVSAGSIALAAQAAPVAERVRGTITAATPASLTVRQTDGTDVKVALGADAAYAAVIASDIKAVAPGSFIGTATKGFGSRMTALEVVVFPPELRGQGEGHYPWDKLPDTAGGQTASSMTNGTVQAGQAPAVSSSMTNGTVGAASSAGGGLHITVAYKGGHKDIVVPPTAPHRGVQGCRTLGGQAGRAGVHRGHPCGRGRAGEVRGGRTGRGEAADVRRQSPTASEHVPFTRVHSTGSGSLFCEHPHPIRRFRLIGICSTA